MIATQPTCPYSHRSGAANGIVHLVFLLCDGYQGRKEGVVHESISVIWKVLLPHRCLSRTSIGVVAVAVVVADGAGTATVQTASRTLILSPTRRARPPVLRLLGAHTGWTAANGTRRIVTQQRQLAILQADTATLPIACRAASPLLLHHNKANRFPSVFITSGEEVVAERGEGAVAAGGEEVVVVARTNTALRSRDGTLKISSHATSRLRCGSSSM